MAIKKDKAENAKQVKDAHGEKAKDAGEAKSNGLIGKLLLAAFVSAVVITETFVFFFLVPSGEEVAALAEHRLITIAQEIDAKEKEHEAEEDHIIEFDLGTFSISFIPPGADMNYRVEFRLYGELHAKDLEHMQAVFDERQGRFRNRMLLEIRHASLQELEENQLGLIRRRLLATSTELFGDAILLSVGFHDYQVIED